MKRISLFAAILSSWALLTVSCEKELEQVDAHLRFELYDTENDLSIPVRGPQQIPYGTTKVYKLESAYLTSLETLSGPAGWDYRFFPGTNEALVTAPIASDASCEHAGTIVVRAGSLKGEAMTYRLEVTTQELAPEVAFDTQWDAQEIGYGQSARYPLVVSSSVAKMETEASEGWLATCELGSAPVLIVAAPAKIGGGAALGEIRVTPIAPSGKRGAPLELRITAVNEPAIYFPQSTEWKFAAPGETIDVDFTYNNVRTAQVTGYPNGWNVTLDWVSKKLSITAPADISGPTVLGGGAITIALTGEDDTAGTTTIQVRLDMPGIVTAQDFIDFGTAVAEGAPVDGRFLIDGVPTLAMNIDLSDRPDCTFVGSEQGIFDAAFEGNGKHVKIAIEVPVAESVAGLFHTVGPNAVIRNLTVDGSITSRSTITGVTIGGIAAFSQGARFENNTTDIAFVYEPAAWFNFSKKASQYGSVTGKVLNNPGIYSGNVSKGSIRMNAGVMRSVGGQIGIIEIDGTRLTDCTNEASIYIDIPNAGNPCNADNTMFGGLVGNSESWETNYVHCINCGDITIDLHDVRTSSTTNPQIYGVGGIAGVSFGTFSDCVNRGTIWGKECSGSATRRYGGILGGSLAAQSGIKPSAAKDTKNLSIQNCINEGDIKHTSPFVGGIAGMIMQGLYAEVVGCINRGNITNQTVIDNAKERGLQPQALGGVIGQFRGNLVKDCVNEGKVSGQSRHHVGGIIGFGRPYTKDATRPIEVIGCENKGTIEVSSVKGSKTASEILQVGGIISIHDGIWKIENCKNSGRIISTSDETGHVAAVYVHRSGSTVTTDSVTASEQQKKELITDTAHL